jgi:NDP-sugar pyrophosphorylase family protein
MLNGDLVTTFDYRALVKAHRESGNLLTIATRERRVEMDYGVLTVEPGRAGTSRIRSFTEKPNVDVTVSMGIYALEPAALSFIPSGGYFDFPDLVQNLLGANAPVGAFSYDGLWLDIGRQEDYDTAITLLEQGKLAVLDGEFDPSARTASAPLEDEGLDYAAEQ